MPMPRIDWQPVDYSDHIGQGLAGVAKMANDYSPAHELMQQALQRIYNGEDPKAVAAELKVQQWRQQQPQLPSGPPAQQQGSQLRGSMRSEMPPQLTRNMRSSIPTPRRLVGRVEDVTGGMYGSMRSSFDDQMIPYPEGSGPQQTGPREFTEEETVTAPPQLPMGRPMMSGPATSPRSPPQAILNRDVPMLLQGASALRKNESNDLGMLNYLLGRDRLVNNQNQFGQMEVHRGVRDEATRANTAEIPVRRQQAERRLGISAFNAQTGRVNSDTRRGENYMRGAGNATWAVPAMDQLLDRFRSDAASVPGESDYLLRRGAEIAGTLQGSVSGVGGGTAKLALERVADAMLTPEQRDTRRQVRLIVQTMIVHPEFGATLTPQEIALANELTGEQLSPRDTAAGLAAFRQMTAAKWQRYIRLYPDVAQKMGAPTGSNWGGSLPEPGDQGFEYPEPTPGVPRLPSGGR